MDVRGTPPNRSMSNFFLRCNPADLNELGRRIKAWLPNPSDQLAVEWLMPNTSFERTRDG